MRHAAFHRTRGFTLIEVMIASTLSLLVLAGAITAGVYLQRRGLLEERTMETQNAGRSARDLLVPAVQRAGAGFGRARLNLGGNGADVDQRYAVWVTTNAGFASDTSFGLPTGVYAGMVSDAVEIWEADSAYAMQLRDPQCFTTPPARNWDGVALCTEADPGRYTTDGGLTPGTLAVVTNPEVPEACVGVVGAANTADDTIAWTAGVPGRPFPPGSPCADSAVGAVYTARRSLVMPVKASAYRVNWKSGKPVLELDPDGAAGPAAYQPLAHDIERLKVRLGVYNPDAPNTDVRFFPEPDAGRPNGVDQCTNTSCWGSIPGDAGVMGASNTGPGSARDQLMQRLRLVELLITARTQQPDADAVRQGANGGTRDDEGNPRDGYKRRHFLVRIAPRNFAFSGGP